MFFFIFRIYQEKLSALKRQLAQLNDGSHPEYRKKIKRAENAFKERLDDSHAFELSSYTIYHYLSMLKCNFLDICLNDMCYIFAT